VKPILEKAQIDPDKVRDDVYDAMKNCKNFRATGGGFRRRQRRHGFGSAEAAYVLERAKKKRTK